MPKGRRGYYKQPSSVWREPWSNDVLAGLVRLQCYLQERWARDGIPDEEAGRAEIPIAVLRVLTGKDRRDVVATSAQRWANVVSMSVEVRGDVTAINWPKWSEFQHNYGRFARDLGAKEGLRVQRPASASSSSDLKTDPQKNPLKPPLQGGAPAPLELEAKPRKRKPKRREPKPDTPPPDAFNPQQLEELGAFCREHSEAGIREREPHIAELMEACLDHHRKERKVSADWMASARTWIRNDLKFHGRLPPPEPTPFHELSAAEKKAAIRRDAVRINELMVARGQR